jgi:hypothetical protein
VVIPEHRDECDVDLGLWHCRRRMRGLAFGDLLLSAVTRLTFRETYVTSEAYEVFLSSGVRI